MKKKFAAIALISLLSMSLLAGCGNASSGNGSGNAAQNGTAVENGNTATESKYEKIDTDLKVGMATDSGTIDDRSIKVHGKVFQEALKMQNTYVHQGKQMRII